MDAGCGDFLKEKIKKQEDRKYSNGVQQKEMWK